ncbi:hypothetical protein J4209_03795 [Candidatus Woesearchaeota archaeon]|nr:hypothetical protein [Candidatus Woesearchaeota archaeon]
MKTKLLKLSLAMFLIILLASLVQGIAVSPSKKIIEFEPGLEEEVTFNIVNLYKQDFKAVVYIRGELAEFTDLGQTLVSVRADQDSVPFSFKIKLPQDLKPGLHDSEIVVMEFPKEFAAEEDTPVIKAVTAVIAQLKVRVPFPGKYAEAKMYVYPAEPAGIVRFVIPVFNYGRDTIHKANARISILGATYEEIATIETNSVEIATKGEGQLVADWKADVNPGTYHAVAFVYYDDEQIKLEDNFNIGNLFVEITKVAVDKFSLGQVARFDIYLRNKWNEELKDVYGEMTVSDKAGSVYTTFKTANVNLAAYGEDAIQAYWDTKDVSIGKYDLRLVIYYAGKTTEKLIEAEVNIDNIRTSLTPTAQLIAPTGRGRNSMLVILVVVLIAINIGWFAYFKRSRKK